MYSLTGIHCFIIILLINGGYMLKYYAHTFSKYYGFMLTDINRLEEILKSGFVLSRRKLNLPLKDALFNGMDYISLCDLEKEHEYNSAYNLYVKSGVSLLFSKDFKVIHPQIITLDSCHINLEDMVHRLGMNGRYSDLSDEVQVKDSISLDYLKGLLVSLESMKESHSDRYNLDYLRVMKELLLDYNKDVPIINLDDEKEIKIYEKNL